MFSRAAMIFVRILFAILPVEANETKKRTNKQTDTHERKVIEIGGGKINQTNPIPQSAQISTG